MAIGLVMGDHILRQVAIFHPWPRLLFLIKTWQTPLGMLNIGGLGVIIFLVLSGMVLEYNYGSRPIRYFAFLFRRFKRLYLVYWLCLVLSYPLLLGVGWPTKIKYIFYNVSGLLLYTGRPWTDYFIPTAFFIGLILYLYLFFPILSRFLRKNSALTLIILFLISVISRYFIGQTEVWFRGPDGFPLCRLFEFGLGIWLAQRSQVISFFQRIDAKIRNRLIFWLAELSFPAFLMHSTVLKLNLFSVSWLSVLKFLEITIVLSLAVYLLNDWIGKLRFSK